MAEWTDSENKRVSIQQGDYKNNTRLPNRTGDQDREDHINREEDRSRISTIPSNVHQSIKWKRKINERGSSNETHTGGNQIDEKIGEQMKDQSNVEKAQAIALRTRRKDQSSRKLTLGVTTINWKEGVKYLGIHINCKWRKYIEETAKKAKPRISMINVQIERKTQLHMRMKRTIYEAPVRKEQLRISPTPERKITGT